MVLGCTADLEELHMNMNPLQFDWEDLIADGANNPNHAPNGAGPMLPVPPLPFHNPDIDTDGDSSDTTSSGSSSIHGGGSSRDSSSGGGGGMHGYRTSAVNRLAARLNMPDLPSHGLPTSLTANHGIPTFPALQSLIGDAAGAGRNMLPSHAYGPPREPPVASSSRWLPAYSRQAMSPSSAHQRFSNDLELTPTAATATAAGALGAGPSGTTGTGPAPADLQEELSPRDHLLEGARMHATAFGGGHISASSEASGSSGAPSTWNSDKGTAARWYSEQDAPEGSTAAVAEGVLAESSTSDGSSPMSVAPVAAAGLEVIGTGFLLGESQYGIPSFFTGRSDGFECPTASTMSPFVQPSSSVGQGGANHVLHSSSSARAARQAAVASTSAATAHVVSSASALLAQLSPGDSGLVQLDDGVLSLSETKKSYAWPSTPFPKYGINPSVGCKKLTKSVLNNKNGVYKA